MVFVDGRPLKQVLAKGLLMMNTFFVDEENGRLYIAVPFGTPLFKGEVAMRQRGILVRGANFVVPMFFNVEGAMCFVSGARDVAYRMQPNHLRIFKAGWVLLGTSVHFVDHGMLTPSWANAVVIGGGRGRSPRSGIRLWAMPA